MLKTLWRTICSALSWTCCKCGHKWDWAIDVCKNCGHPYCEQCQSD